MHKPDHDDKDSIPTLHDLVRPGKVERRRPPEKPSEGTADAGNGLTAQEIKEIEAIATRVVERHTQTIENAVARGISKALELRARQAGKRQGTKHKADDDG